MDSEFLTYYKEFADSFNRFKDAAAESKEEYEKDLVTQRFQFTFYAFLNVLKFLLKKNKVDCDYPSKCIEKAAHFGLLPVEQIYLDMLEDSYEIIKLKNQITEKLFQKIKVKYVIALGTFMEKMEKTYFTEKG